MKKIHYAWWIVVACCAINSCNGIIVSSATNFFNPVAQTLHVGIGQITVYVTVMSLTMAALYPLIGKLMRNHLKPLIVFGGVIQYGTLAMMSTFQYMQQFWIAGLFLGIGAAITYAMAVPVLINMWFRKSQGLALGIALSFQGIAAAVFSIVAGNTITALGWRNAYLLLAVCGIMMYIPTVVFLVKTPKEKGIQPYGSELCAEESDKALIEVDGITLKQAIRCPSFYCMIAGALFLAMVASEATQVSSFSSGHFHYDLITAAAMVAVYNIGLMAGNLLLGMIDDRIGHVGTFLLAMGMIITSQIMLYLGQSIPVAIFMMGFAFSSYNLLLPLITRYIFGSLDYSRIWSFLMSAGSFSGAFIVPIYGSMFDATGSYNLVFIFAGITGLLVAIIGTAALVLRPEKHANNI